MVLDLAVADIRRLSRTLPLPRRAINVSALLLFLLFSPAWAQNGIFADFTTSKGNFTCVLDYTNAPKAVANFIGLATGQRAWLDLPTGQVRTNRFYDGLTFHRVIAGFMIQGGSPNGQGTDGPGYVFPDEFTPALRFTGTGVLAMANSGPKSNGSQYFVTVAPTPWLNDVHTIFGWVVSGTNVVAAISQVATNANSKPLTDVVVQTVGIRRVGAAAQNFDPNAQGVPVVHPGSLAIANGPNQVALTYTNHAYLDSRIYASSNLVNWSANLLGIEGVTPTGNQVYAAKNLPAGFYSLAQIQYASSTFAPKTLANRTLTMTFSGAGPMTIVFNATSGGTYTYPPYSPGTITGYNWSQEPYRGYGLFYFSAFYPVSSKLDFTSNTTGNCSATVWQSGVPGTPPYSSLTGTFTLLP